jgi:hypothetical protein
VTAVMGAMSTESLTQGDRCRKTPVIIAATADAAGFDLGGMEVGDPAASFTCFMGRRPGRGSAECRIKCRAPNSSRSQQASRAKAEHGMAPGEPAVKPWINRLNKPGAVDLGKRTAERRRFATGAVLSICCS